LQLSSSVVKHTSGFVCFSVYDSSIPLDMLSTEYTGLEKRFCRQQNGIKAQKISKQEYI
jgi:hypothetical protein